MWKNSLDKYIKLLFCIIVCLLAGYVGSFYTVSEITGWYRGLAKPFFSPPNWIFGPMWTLLYILMGISLYLVWKEKFVVKNEISNSRIKVCNIFSKKPQDGKWQKINTVLPFFFQLILNVLWSVLFFGLHSPAFAFFELIILWFAIAFTIISFYKVSKTASYLLIPYILWVSFAGILNFFVWILN